MLPQITVIRCVESSAWDLLVLFTWLTVVDVARHAKLNSSVVIGVGWAFYAGSFAGGSMLASWFFAMQVDVAVTTLLMFALALVGTFCLEVRDQDTKWIFAELSGERSSAPEDHRSIDERCAAIGQQHGLTPRELEVMQMLCKGRTKSYIAETLYLTENTVRSHTKHIYTKLDVHSKQEASAGQRGDDGRRLPNGSGPSTGRGLQWLRAVGRTVCAMRLRRLPAARSRAMRGAPKTARSKQP